MPNATHVVPDPTTRTFKPRRILLAWGVHLFTALGAVFAVVALAEIGGGDIAAAAMWVRAALVLDYADGTMARAGGG